MKQLTKTCFTSDDNYVGCARTKDGQFAYMENDPTGIRIIKIVSTLWTAKLFIQEYEEAMAEFWEIFE